MLLSILLFFHKSRGSFSFPRGVELMVFVILLSILLIFVPPQSPVDLSPRGRIDLIYAVMSITVKTPSLHPLPMWFLVL